MASSCSSTTILYSLTSSRLQSYCALHTSGLQHHSKLTLKPTIHSFCGIACQEPGLVNSMVMHKSCSAKYVHAMTHSGLLVCSYCNTLRNGHAVQPHYVSFTVLSPDSHETKGRHRFMTCHTTHWLPNRCHVPPFFLLITQLTKDLTIHKCVGW